MNDETQIEIKPIQFWQSFIIFLFPSIGVFISIKIGIPIFKSLGLAQNVSYMLSMICILFPVLLGSIIAFRLEGNRLLLKVFFSRYRIKFLTKKDWLWILIGFVLILLFSGLLQFGVELICKILKIKYYTVPPELGFRRIKINEWWIYLIHFFYFLCNILGEEFLYRGYLLPRQELKHGNFAWLINGGLWIMVHLGIGLSVITMIPLLLIVPYIVQRQKNVLIGIIIHGLIAGMGFYLIAFGLIN